MLATPLNRSRISSTLRRSLQTLALVAATSAIACTARKASADLANSSSDQPGESGSSGEGTGSGHLHITGDLTLDYDFLVDECQISPPGDGLLAGYRMQAKDGDSTIILLSAVVKSYDKDGAYSPTVNTAIGQATEVMNTGSQDFLTLMVASKSSPVPIAVGLQPGSKLVTTISNNGAKGEIAFTDMEAPPSFEDMKSATSGKPHGKRMSGSIVWTCGHIDRLNPEMNAAVNGMMKKRIPAR
jgi:hypothetical protein